MIGIYKIENLLNGHCYIGQSRDIKKRWRVHCCTFEDNLSKCYDYPLYRAFRKYGIENFSFEVLQECSVEELDNLEKHYIEKFDSYWNGYNQDLGGGGRPSLLKDHVLGIIQDLETTEMTQGEIAKKWGVDISTVNGINTGRTWHHNRKYPIQSSTLYKKKLGQNITGKSKDDWICVDCGKKISKGSTRCRTCNDKYRKSLNQKPVTREELKGLIRTTSFAEIGRRYGVTDNSIRKWCDFYNLPRRTMDIKAISDEDWLLI